jgi:hypothetical protein
MPIEIKELHIKVSVTSSQLVKAPAEKPRSGTEGSDPGASREEIVAECVEKVLEIFRDKNER